MMNGRNWSYLILIAIIITLTVLVIYFASRNKSKSCHSKDGYSTSGDSTSGDDTYNKLNRFLSSIYSDPAAEEILGSYFFALKAQKAAHVNEANFHDNSENSVTEPSKFYVYMSAPLFDKPQCDMNNRNAAAIESHKDYKCVVPARNLFEGLQLPFITCPIPGHVNGWAWNTGSDWTDLENRLKTVLSPENHGYIKIMQENWSDIWAQLMQCIEYYVMTYFCNAASSNYTFTDTGSVIESAYMAGINMPLVLYLQNPPDTWSDLPATNCKVITDYTLDQGSKILTGCAGQYCPACAGASTMANALTGSLSPCVEFATSPDELSSMLVKLMATSLAKKQLLQHAKTALYNPPLNTLPSIYVGAKVWYTYIKDLGAKGSGELSNIDQNPSREVCMHRCVTILKIAVDLAVEGDFQFECKSSTKES